MKKKAFTLAEVLIALTIIGIISAITVPVLHQNSQEQELTAGLKKAYSVLKQAESLYYTDRGEKLTGSDWSGEDFRKMFPKYFNVLIDCGSIVYSDHNKKCLSSSDFSKTYKNYNGSASVSSGWFDNGEFILNDGMYVFLDYNAWPKFVISIDVNGPNKKPNRLGRDLFMFQLWNDGIVPMGASNTYWYDADDKYCSDTSTDAKNGAGCTYKALQK